MFVRVFTNRNYVCHLANNSNKELSSSSNKRRKINVRGMSIEERKHYKHSQYKKRKERAEPVKVLAHDDNEIQTNIGL